MTTCQTTRRLRVEYSAPVRDCARELRVLPPQQRGGQSTLQLQWSCDPAPDWSEEIEDTFGNRVLRLRHERIARAFAFEAEFTTSHNASTPVPLETNLPPTGIGAYLLPSALCDLSPEIEKLSAELQRDTPPLPQLVTRICEFAYQQVEYSPGATSVQTSASQSLQQKKGVCQDHSHLMIALCRAAKIPARYISGYIPGEGAMHAWVEVLLENQWRGFDPTHNREMREEYVFVACGRDFRDCNPVSGSYRGNAIANLTTFYKTLSLV